jgi:hypothetical protein
MGLGPPPGAAGNKFRNNILAAARKSMFRFPSPWPASGCDDKSLRVGLADNIFDFDRDASAGFQVVRGCAYSCGLDHAQFESFQGNLYWRADGGFSADPQAFRVNPARCTNPADTANTTPLSFAQWQTILHEDTSGTASVNPGFGKTHTEKDYLLSRSPLTGFDHLKTNDTIRNAGRSHPTIMPPKVLATFPTYSFEDFK